MFDMPNEKEARSALAWKLVRLAGRALALLGTAIVLLSGWLMAGRSTGLERLDASHLFAPSVTRLALRRDGFLRGYVYDFIARFAPALDRAAVDAALASKAAPGAE